MKRFRKRPYPLLVMAALLGCLFYSLANADPQILLDNRLNNTLTIMSSQRITASGTSTYIIDLKDPQFYPVVEGDFSLQFSGLSCPTAQAGATVSAAYRISNVLPSGNTVAVGLLRGSASITDNLESVNIVTDLAWDTGNTQYVYDFWPQKARYLIIDISAGSEDMTVSATIDMD